MSTTRNTLAEAIEAWRALDADQRRWIIEGAVVAYREGQGEFIALEQPFDYSNARCVAADAAAVLLRAAAEPEAKAPTCETCGGLGVVPINGRDHLCPDPECGAP